MMGSFRGLEGALSSPSNLGPGYGVSTGGLTFGGGGGALLFGRLWIGGKGYGLTLGTGVTPSGSASLFGGGGGFELGVAAVNHARWLVIPYVGLGAFGYSLTVNNATGAAFKLSPNDTVPARGSQDFTAGSATGEVGLRVMRLLFSGSGGFAAGAEVGYMSALGRDAWKGPEKVNTGLEAADMGAAYVRLIVGGGGFFGRKSE